MGTPSTVFRVAATAAFFGATAPLVISMLFASFGAFVTITHGSHPGILEALSVVFSDWSSKFTWFYRGTLTAAFGGAAFSAVFHRLAITGSSISKRDLKFYAGGGCVAASYVIFPLSFYSMPGFEIPFWIVITGTSGGLVGIMVPKSLLPAIPTHQREINV